VPFAGARIRTGRAGVPTNDGFDEVFGVLGPSLEINDRPADRLWRATYDLCDWVTTGVLERTGRRGVYQTTDATRDRFRRVWARIGVGGQ
jgi:hypothetical protein